jgi:type IV secretion system protein VirD4
MTVSGSLTKKPRRAGLILGRIASDHDGRAKRMMGFAPNDHHEKKASRSQPLVTYPGDGHLMCVATTGAGKGRCLIIPTLLTYPGPVTVIDPKGENYLVAGRRRREMGHRVIALDPFGIASDQADRLNPFDLFLLAGSHLDADAELFADLLTGGEPTTTKEPFWDLTSGGLLTGLTGLTMMEEDPARRNLGTLLDLLYDGDCDYKIAVALDSKKFPHQLIYNELAGYLSNESDKCRPSIKSTAQAKVKALGCDAIRKAMTDSTFDLGSLERGEPIDIFVIMPPDKLRSHRAVLRLWMGVLMTALVRRPFIPSERTLVILDEAAQLGSLNVLRQAVTLLRGYGVQMWTFWQDLSQLKRLYPEDWPTLLNNAAVVQVFGITNGLMAAECAAVLGCKPQELLRMRPNRQMVVMPRMPARVLRRLDYLRDRRFKGLFAPNPRHAAVERGL